MRAESQPTADGRSALLVGAATLSTLFVVALLYVTLPMSGHIAARYGVDARAATWVSVAFGLPYSVGFLVWGPASDRLGREVVLVSGLLLTAAAGVGVAVAPTFSALLAARAVQGFVAASVPPTVLALLAERLSPARRPYGIAAVSFCFLLAAPLGQLVGAAAGDALRPLALALAAIHLLCAGAAWIGAAPLCLVPGGSRPAAVLPARHASGLLGPWIASASVLFAYVTFSAALHRAGTALPVALDTIQLALLPTIGLTLLAGVLILRLGALLVSRLGLLAIVAGLLVVAATPSLALLGGAILMAAGVALACPALIALIAARAPPAGRGFAVAVYAFALYLGASLAPLAADALGGLRAACLVPAAAAALALLILTPISRGAKSFAAAP